MTATPTFVIPSEMDAFLDCTVEATPLAEACIATAARQTSQLPSAHTQVPKRSNQILILPHGHAYSRGGHLVGMHTSRRRPKTKVRAKYDAAHFSRASPMTGLRSSASNTVATEHVESPQRRQELYYVRRPRPAYWIASATSPLSRCAGLGRTRGGNRGGGESA